MKTRLTHEELLSQLAQFILDATLAFENETIMEEELPSAADMGRQLGLDTELVKKKLKLLKHEGLIQALSYSPKRYRFDHYQLNHLSESSELYPIFLDPDTPYALDFERT